jgi:hypothetical protein
MAILEAMLQPSVAVGFAAGLFGLRHTIGTILRPLAKSVVKGALVVGDGVTALLDEAQRAGTDANRPVAIRLAAATPTSRKRSRSRDASTGTRRAATRKTRVT